MSLRQRRSGFLADLFYIDAEGRKVRWRKQLHTKVEAEALAAHDAIKEYFDNGGAKPTIINSDGSEVNVPATYPRKGKLPLPKTVGELAERYKVYTRGARQLEPDSEGSEFQRVDTIASALSDVPLSTARDPILEFFASLKVEKRKHATIKHYRGVLKRMFDYAIMIGCVEDNPSQHIAKVKVPDPDWTFFTYEEASRFEDIALSLYPHLARGWLVAMDLGLRRGELYGLLGQDYNQVLGTLSIVRSLKGDLSYRPTKSKRRRTLPVKGTRAEKILRSMGPLAPGAPIFTRPNGDLMGKNQDRSQLRRVIRQMELGRDFTFYDLRHTFGSWAAMANVPIRRIQQWMGHSTITVTERYMHLSPQNDQPDMDILQAHIKKYGTDVAPVAPQANIMPLNHEPRKEISQ